eukprot:6529702-Pyramimonas_sp.AAC.2
MGSSSSTPAAAAATKVKNAPSQLLNRITCGAPTGATTHINHRRQPYTTTSHTRSLSGGASSGGRSPLRNNRPVFTSLALAP